jgi:ABC-type transporter Mla maintaining outer membrane lipid asymmetry permease subunit MlaE
MNTSILDQVGHSTLGYLEYVGGLVIQSGKTIRALPKTVPLIGNWARWRSAIGQMLAVGVEAIPMVGYARISLVDLVN